LNTQNTRSHLIGLYGSLNTLGWVGPRSRILRILARLMGLQSLNTCATLWETALHHFYSGILHAICGILLEEYCWNTLAMLLHAHGILPPLPPSATCGKLPCTTFIWNTPCMPQNTLGRSIRILLTILLQCCFMHMEYCPQIGQQCAYSQNTKKDHHSSSKREGDIEAGMCFFCCHNATTSQQCCSIFLSFVYPLCSTMVLAWQHNASMHLH